MSPLTQSPAIEKPSSWRHRALDGAVVLGITLGIGLISQRWTGLDTPDSSFYLSLGLHGDAITDRVAEPYYAWTRLGAILPMRALTTLFGTFPGLEAYRLLLLIACVAGAFLTLRRFTDRTWSALLTLMILLNTVLLGYLGNPYLTRSVFAGTFLIIAVATSTYVQRGQLNQPTRRVALITGTTAGVIVGWLVMTNPYGAILAGTLWVVLIGAATIRIRTTQAATALLYALVAALVGSLLTWVAFLLAGRATFPTLDWLQTYMDWNARLTYSDFASPEPVWLSDISLLVPVAILITTAFAWLINRRSLPAQLGFLLSASIVALTFALEPLMGGITLEAPMYQAMLWPPLLMGIACSATAVQANARLTWISAAIGVVGIASIALAGRWPGPLDAVGGVLLTAGITVTCCLLWRWATKIQLQKTCSQTSINRRVVGAIAGLAVLLAGAQLLQNSRRDLGLYYLSPYANAYLANAIETKVRTAVNAQDFVLQNTTPEDEIQLWVGGDWAGGDRELYVVAGMQMWGPNIATLDPTLSETKAAQLRTTRPTVIEMVAPSMPQLLEFWSSLPRDANPSPPNCYDFSWPSERVPTGHLCLSNLNWSQAS